MPMFSIVLLHHTCLVLLRYICTLGSSRRTPPLPVGKVFSLSTEHASFSSPDVEKHLALDRAFFSAIATGATDHMMDTYGRVVLAHTRLYECSCANTGAHNRTILHNTRKKIEDLILDHASKNLTSERVSMLSMGAGGLLQDLVLAARLADSGARSIHMVLVERHIDMRAYRDFLCIVERMASVYEMDVSLGLFESVEDVSAEERFDIVYAIDFEEYSPYHDYSERKLPGRSLALDSDAYLASVDMVRAANMAKILAVMSRGKNILSLIPEQASSCHDEFRDLKEVAGDIRSFDAFYLNADIGVLLTDMEFFAALERPLFINKAIVQEKDRHSVSVFLDRCGIAHEFIDDNSFLRAFGECMPCKECLIIDCTIFDRTRGEEPIDEMYKKPRFSVIRCDWAKSCEGNVHMDVYAYQPSPRQSSDDAVQRVSCRPEHCQARRKPGSRRRTCGLQHAPTCTDACAETCDIQFSASKTQRF